MLSPRDPDAAVNDVEPHSEPGPRERLARALWAAAGPPDSTPGRAYLARRRSWPPAGTGPELPATVRWLPVSKAPAADQATKWHGLPDGAAGTLVFAWRAAEALRPHTWTIEREIGRSDTWEALGKPTRHRRKAEQQMGFLKLVDRHARFRLVRNPPIPLRLVEEHGRYKFVIDDDSPEAVSLLAVSADGVRGAKAQTIGNRTGAVFVARPDRTGGDRSTIHVTDGERDALALALAPWCGPGAVYAVSGTSGLRRAGELPGTGAVVVHCDGDPTGRGQAEWTRYAIEAAGRPCRVEPYAVGSDPADALAEWLRNRAAILEVEGGMTGDDAERAAWEDAAAKSGEDGE